MSDTTLCLFGEVLFDRFPDGRTVLGGAPFNVAWHLAGFGERPRLISAVGQDEAGVSIRRAMDDWGLDSSSLWTIPGYPTGVVEVSLTAGEPCFEIAPDVAYDHIPEAAAGCACGLLYHGTLALRSNRSARTLEALRLRACGPVFFDVNLRAPWWSRGQVLTLLDGADWVKLNQDELVALTPPGADIAARAEALRAAHDLTGVIVTLGAAGALACVPDQPPIVVAPPPETQVVDTVGAGDAFAAVLILGLRRGWPLALTMERAQAFATRIVAQPGAVSTDPALYAAFRSDWF